MKFLLKLVFLSFLMTVAGILPAQSIIGFYDFESSPSGTIAPGTTPTFKAGSSTSSDRVASTPFFVSGDSAWGITNTTSTITFSNVSLSGYTNCFIRFRLAAFSIASGTNGLDVGDSVVVLVSTDGGSNYIRELAVRGNNNAYWSYSTGTGLAEKTLNGSLTDFNPAAGGARTTDGYSAVRINIPNGNTQVRVQIRASNNNTGELWVIDSLSVMGTVSASTSSDIIASGQEMVNIPYVTKTGGSISSTADAHRLWRFTIRDGGGAADADALGTEMLSVKIKKAAGDNTTGGFSSTLNRVALFDGTTKIAETAPSGDSIVFTGLSGSNVTAADGGTKNIDVYATFLNSTNQDNKQIQMMIQSSDVSASGSQFTSFSTAQSGIGGDSNRIEVTADRLMFTTQPTNTGLASAMANVVVAARDTNSLTDLDFNSVVRITSSGTMTGSPLTATASSGVATFSGITHTAVQSGVYLVAQRNATLDWNRTSSTFNITAIANSDIVHDNTLTYTSNIPYKDFQAAAPLTNTSGNEAVFRVKIRDGGASANDVDTLPTTLSAITFANTVGIKNIRAAALFSGNTLVANNPTINSFAGSISFTGLSYSARDNADTTLSLRVSFYNHKDSITDNQQMKFYVSSSQVTAAGSGSLFSSFATDSSSTSGDRNRIEVTRDRPEFGTQPTDGAVGVNLGSFTLRAVDANACLDLDAGTTDSIFLSTTGTGMSSSSFYTFTSGISSISNVNFSSVQTGVRIIAYNNSWTGDTDDTSSAFNIEVIPANSFRTVAVGSGTWGTATWERFVSGTWTSSSAPSTSTTDYVFVYHNISSGGSISPSNVLVMNNATLTISGSSTIGNLLWVKTGGKVTLTASTTISDSIQIDSSATLAINFSASGTSPLWNGTEVFHPYSNLEIINWNASATTPQLLNSSSVLTNYSYNGFSAPFGNINYNLLSDPGADMTIIEGGNSQNLCHGNFVVTNSGGRSIRLSTSGTVTTQIKGNIKFESSFAYIFNFKTSGDLNLIVGGDVIVNGGTIRLFTGNSASDTSQLTINGNMTINGGSFSLNSTVGSAVNLLNLKGDLSIGFSGVLKNVGSTTTSKFRFNGTGDGSSDALTQTINSASTQANENERIDFEVQNGAYVKVINTNFQLGNLTDLIVQTGGVLDFGFNGTTALNITETSGTTTFTQETGATIKITNVDGIDKDGSNNVGNVRTDTRTFSSTGIYHYIGIGSTQRIGDGVPTSSGGKTIIIETSDTTQVVFEGYDGTFYVTTGNIGISVSGLLNIKKGILVGTANADFTGSNGPLTMSGGTYRISVDSATAYANNASGNGVVPQLGGTFTLSGGTIELNGTNNIQRLRGTTYPNITITGSNQYLTNYKTVSSATTINNSLTISGTSVFDTRSNGITGTADLNMTGGRWRISKVSNTQPELTGDYTISGGTFELYGTSSSNNQTIRGLDGSSNTISWFNIDLGANEMNSESGNVSPGASFQIQYGGTLTVYKPCIFRLDATDIVSGFATFVLRDSAGIYTAHASGFNGNLTLSLKTYSSRGVYGVIGNTDQTFDQSAVQDTVGAFVFNKSIGTLNVNISGNEVYIRDSLKWSKGRLNITGSGFTLMDNGITNGASDSSYCLISGITKYGNDAFVFPIGTASEGFKPIGISAPDHVNDAFTASYSRTNPWTYTGNFPTGVHHISKCEYWDLHEEVDAGSATAVNVTLYFDLKSGCGLSSDSNYITDLSKIRVCHYNGSSWETYTTHFSAGNDNNGSITAQGVSSFSPFTIGSTDADPVNPLPLDLVYIKHEGDAQNQLWIEWKVTGEEEIDSYQILVENEGEQKEIAADHIPAGNGYYRQAVATQEGLYILQGIHKTGQIKTLATLPVMFSQTELRVGPQQIRIPAGFDVNGMTWTWVGLDGRKHSEGKGSQVTWPGLANGMMILVLNDGIHPVQRIKMIR